MKAGSVVLTLAKLAAAVIALWILALTGLAVLLLSGVVTPPGTESSSSDTREDWRARPATLEIDVGFEPSRSHPQDLVLRLDRIDMEAMGLASYVLRPTIGDRFQLRTAHLLEASDAVYEYCLRSEAVLHNYTRQMAEHVFPPGTCLRSDEAYELMIGQ